MKRTAFCFFACLVASSAMADVELGSRPAYLVDQMAEGPLKAKLSACSGPFRPSGFSIAHRGAPMGYPEHTVESYRAANKMGAGIQIIRSKVFWQAAVTIKQPRVHGEGAGS